MRKNLTILSVLAVVGGIVLAVPSHAQTTSDRGVIRNNSTTDQNSQRNMMGRMSEMMENCNNMMQNMQDHHSQMPNQQGAEPTSPRSGN